MSPELSEKKLSKITEKLNQPPELTVFQIRPDSKCAQCGMELFKGSLLLMEQDRSLCMTCTGFKGFIYLSTGNAKLSRLAKQLSGRYAVVEFSRSRWLYERQGLLVETSAIWLFEEAHLIFGSMSLRDIDEVFDACPKKVGDILYLF